MRLRLSLCVLSFLALQNMSVCQTHAQGFVDVTTQAGLASLQWDQSGGFEWAEPNFMSGGAAATDFDGDGWVDLYVTRLDAPDSLYRNKRDGTFEDVTAAHGLSTPTDSNGAAWADVDNDGDRDLYVTTVRDSTKRYHLYINDGAGAFTEEAVARGADVGSNKTHAGYGAAFGDYDADGYLDLMTTEWGNVTPTSLPTFVSHSRLLRNVGAGAPGTFVDTTVSSGIAPTPDDSIRYGFAPRWTDLNNDGLLDLAVASDFGHSQLFWNNGDNTFTDGTAGAGVGTDENGMGSAIADFNGDGHLDWFVTSIYDPDKDTREGDESGGWGISGNRLYMNNGDTTFTDATTAAGVRDGMWGWGAAAFDYDNDGDQDIIMTNGVVFPDFQPDDYFNHDPMRLWQNDGNGVFTEVSASLGVTDTGSGKGLLTFDYDNDGDLDVLVLNNAADPVLYRNDAPGTNGYLRVALSGTESNADGVGAKIYVTPDAGSPGDTMLREVYAGNDFLGQSDIVAHFGLGASPGKIDSLTVYWPTSGITQELHHIDPNQLLEITENIPGDFGGDLVVDAGDAGSWRNGFGTPSGAVLADGDADQDGDVDFADLMYWQNNYGTDLANAPATVTVPEPAALSLALVCLVAGRLFSPRPGRF